MPHQVNGTEPPDQVHRIEAVNETNGLCELNVEASFAELMRHDSCLKLTTPKKADKSLNDETAEPENYVGFGLAQIVPIETSSNHINNDILKQQGFKKMGKNSVLKECGTPLGSSAKKSRQVRSNKRTPKSTRKKYTLRSSASTERVLRSKVKEKPTELEASNSVVSVSDGSAKKKRGRRTKGEKERVVPDEYTKIKKRLKYFLHRIHYEQNLIDAYSSEGWKGHSLEKLRPEKELQRATSEILRRKLKIRDLFQQLDSLCMEGQYPESLFDSDGQLDSEDIFCAKCGSKDLPAGNDIILCDGACDRGFHQFCLEPPLLSKDIPPDDEGWLCPGCDCKVDSIDLLNDSLETDLTVSDSWEKVFAEEAAAAARDGKEPDPKLDVASDDSDEDDDDYNPDGPEIVEKAEGDESGSDESNYSSDDSDELEDQTDENKNLVLSSDDSEDDDFDPDAPDVEETEKPSESVHKQEDNTGDSSDDSDDDNYDPDAPDVDDNVKQECSSSDFTSDSEDLESYKALSGAKNLKRDGNKSSLKDEVAGVLDSGPGQCGSSPITAKRRVEKLDYKKLNDETYGNLPSESSDDEDYGMTGPRKRKKATDKPSSELPNGNASSIQNEEAIQHTPQKRTRQNSSGKDSTNSPRNSHDCSPSSGSNIRKAQSSSQRRLGKEVTQRLLESFKENQYPTKATKESLAQELGITAQQVDKWFGNLRWSSRHPSRKEASTTKNGKKTTVPSPQSNKKPLDMEQRSNIDNPTCNGTQNVKLPEKQDPAEASGGQKSTPSKKTSGRKKGRTSTVKSGSSPATVTPPVIGVRTRGQRRNSVS